MEKGGEMKGKMPLKMGSHDGASGSGQTQDHESRLNALGGQGSPYSLRLNEVQNHVGDSREPLESMNLDELFKIVWTAENSQGMGGVDYGASSQHSQGALGASLQQQSNVMLSRDLSEKTDHEVQWELQQGLKSCNVDSGAQERQASLGAMTLEDFLVKAGVLGVDSGASSQHSQGALGASLQQQSNMVLSRDLSEKAAHEVRRDIQQGLKSCTIDCEAQERQATLGAMTLEDLLVKAGVLGKTAPGKNDSGSVLGVDPISLPQQQSQWTHHQIQSNHQPQLQPQHQQQNIVSVLMPWQPVQQPTPSNVNSMVGVAYPDTQMTMSPTTLTGTLLDMQTPGRKRVASGDVVENSVEARQKRKMKNRESAARLRSKKQAYIHELENAVARLKEVNGRLKRQKEMHELLSTLPTPEPKYKLRRTSSALF